ncbi:MAG TPA: BON domain-containing protein [Nitrospiria bacterium]|nr:BON domain-containing protein [Nitrospiria bacterium]
MKIKGGALWVVSVLFVTLTQSTASHAMQHEKSDLWIKTAVESFMERDGHLNLNRIGVSSHSGIVKLNGTVYTGEEKGLAELIAMQIPGVRGVENDMRVIPPLDQDIAIEKQARAALIENPLLDIEQLRVRAADGVVTLLGIVDRNREKHLADRLVSMLPDVHKVVDRMETLRRA